MKLSWTTTQRKINDLSPNSTNPRKISNKQLKDLEKSLKKFNLVEIPVIDKDQTILAGHQRMKVMQLLGRGEELIDVRVPNRKLTNTEVNSYMIGSNSLGGSWDYDKLTNFTPELLTDLGFESIEISNIWDKGLEVKPDDFDEEKEIKKIKSPKTKLGDVIALGNHKLICGDSTNPKILHKLFGNERAVMIYSDPVYNIQIDYNKGVGGKQSYGGKVQDNRSEQDYRKLIKDSLSSALGVSKKDLHVFYWSDQKYIWLIQTLYQELGISNKRVCMWIKNGHNPTPGVAFNKCYEPCTYGTIGSPFLTDKTDITEVLNKDAKNGNALLDDIWAIKRLRQNEYKHATSKPPELHEKAILRCTKPGDIILDSFAGSGSTLIAAEQLKRKVYCVELEPVFCDLIIARWEKLTGQKAKLIKRYEKES